MMIWLTFVATDSPSTTIPPESKPISPRPEHASTTLKMHCTKYYACLQTTKTMRTKSSI